MFCRTCESTQQCIILKMVSQTKVQWKSLTLKEPPTSSRCPLYQLVQGAVQVLTLHRPRNLFCMLLVLTHFSNAVIMIGGISRHDADRTTRVTDVSNKACKQKLIINHRDILCLATVTHNFKCVKLRQYNLNHNNVGNVMFTSTCNVLV